LVLKGYGERIVEANKSGKKAYARVIATPFFFPRL
jgi:hypothetical protein